MLADGYGHALGGKGANQAVSAARHDVSVAMVGYVGDNVDGARLTAALTREGVASTSQARGRACGRRADRRRAFRRQHDHRGPGRQRQAPARRRAPSARSAACDGRGARRARDPLDAVAAAAAGAARIVVKPAPARPLPTDLLRRVDVLVPNLPELAALTGGGAPETLEEVARRGRDLAHGGAVVVTLGDRGGLVLDAEGDTHVPAPAVDAIDTTGAGDAFCGSLAAQLARGRALVDAVRGAVRVGALSATRPGALEAFPSRDEIRAALAQRP